MGTLGAYVEEGAAKAGDGVGLSESEWNLLDGFFTSDADV